MEFNINSPVLFVLAGITVGAVILQSVIFLRKAWKRAIELNIKEETLKKITKQTIIFTIAPAIAIGIGLITLAPMLGIPLPWVRLSVVGAISYELPAAQLAADALGISLTGGTLTAKQFTTIAWTMTGGIITGIFLVPVFCKRTVTGLSTGIKDKKWSAHLSNALFFGLIATFVGQGVSGITVDGKGQVKAIVLLVSSFVMVICGLLKNKFKWNWINDYALPICMIISMLVAIPLSIWLI